MNEQQLLKEFKTFLKYDDNTGQLIVIRQRRRSKFKVGQALGTVDSGGYLFITHNSKQYRIHRIVWLLHFSLGSFYDKDLAIKARREAEQNLDYVI